MSTKKELIVKSALELFTSSGIDSTSTASIAKKAGVGTGTVFHHFKNKEEIVHACFALVKERLQERFKTVGTSSRDEMRKKFWRLTIEWYLDHPDEMNFMNLYQQDPKIAKGKGLKIIVELSNFIMNFLEEGKKAKEIKNFNTDYILLLAHNSCILAAQYIMENPKIDKNKVINSSLDLFMSGVQK